MDEQPDFDFPTDEELAAVGLQYTAATDDDPCVNPCRRGGFSTSLWDQLCVLDRADALEAAHDEQLISPPD